MVTCQFLPPRRSWFIAVAILCGLGLCATARAEHFEWECSANTTGNPSPQPAFVGELISTGLTANSSKPSESQEHQVITGPSWGWAVDKVELKTTSNGSWSAAPSGSHEIGIEHPNATSPTATLRARLLTPAYWKITVKVTVGYSDNQGNTWSGSDTKDVEMVAGDWVAKSPDERVPDPPASGDEVTEVKTESDGGEPAVYLTRYRKRSSNFCKATVSGGVIPDDADTWDDGWSVSTGNGTWKRVVQWVPVGSEAKQQQFDYSVTAQFGWAYAGDIDNGTFLAPHGAGSTKGNAVVKVTAAPGTSSANEKEIDFNISKVEDQEISWSVSIPWGASVQPPPGDDWGQVYTTSLSKTIDGTIDSGSGSEVDTEAKLNAQADVEWSNRAEGPFVAHAQCEVSGVSIVKRTSVP